MKSGEQFHKNVKAAVADHNQQELIANSVRKHRDAFGAAIQQYANLELARERAAYLRWKVHENLDKYLIDFEANLLRRGGKVFWAHDAPTALKEVEQIVKRIQPKTIVKSKSALCDEIGLVTFLRQQGYNIHETDLGDYIGDSMKEKAFHPLMPVLHKSRGEINEHLNKTISASLDIEIDALAQEVRQTLRPDFYKAEVGITGANFLIAENGLVSVTENEGNVRLCSTFVKTHIVIAGIDKIIASINDVDLFYPMLSTYGTGQKIATYNTILGPRTVDEEEGPNEFIVILVDNGRSNLLASQAQREALNCIHCGACHHVCPVYTTIGGHAFGTTNNGPIGSVSEPLAQGIKELGHLSFASSNCGRCKDVCPVKIDLPNHLTRNRREAVQHGEGMVGGKIAWFAWKKAMLSRKHMNRSTSIKNFSLRQFFKNDWGEQREFPKVEDKSFNQLWREKFGGV